VREVVRDRQNGRLLQDESVDAFSEALMWIYRLSRSERRHLREQARATAEAFSMARTADKALACYEQLIAQERETKTDADEQWQRVLNLLKAEWAIIRGMAAAAGAALGEPGSDPAS